MHEFFERLKVNDRVVLVGDVRQHQAVDAGFKPVDEAATMDVLCSDKTGTLTRNELSVNSVRPMQGFDEAHVLVGRSGECGWRSGPCRRRDSCRRYNQERTQPSEAGL
jgi:magnesium-transporting ATPase (P-type)